MAIRRNKWKKALARKAKKPQRGYPIATVAYYGPDNKRASKVVAAILTQPDTDPEIMKKWFSDNDARKAENINKEIVEFITESKALSVAYVEEIIGCPHEQGIDYEGNWCPSCPYWHGRDRWTGQMVN